MREVDETRLDQGEPVEQREDLFAAAKPVAAVGDIAGDREETLDQLLRTLVGQV